ncbi:MAG: NUDIX domain-containing protein [Candidatus Staskawiczbacteria bacterium]|jgi:8-oxo-dGTP pyrophosphatase MutT (NUDIX family)
MAKITPTIGVFAGIIEVINGRLLLRRRTEEGSIIPGQSFLSCWELPGGGAMDQGEIPYSHLARELERELGEELGTSVDLNPMPQFFAVLFKGAKTYDLALVTPIVVSSLFSPKGDVVWVSPIELDRLAKEFVAPDKDAKIAGRGLLGGYGKRMHCMALKSLEHSPNADFSSQARRMLVEIENKW